MELRGLTLLKSKEIVDFRDYLEVLTNVMDDVNYVPSIEIWAFELAGHELPINEVLLMACPDSEPQDAMIEVCEPEKFREITNDFLTPIDYSTGQSRRLRGNTQEWRELFWLHLDECIDTPNAIVYDCDRVKGVPYSIMTPCFTWLIHNQTKKRCLLLSGTASD